MPIIRLSDANQFTAIELLSDPGHIGGAVVIPNYIRVNLLWSMADGKVARNVLGGTVAPAFVPTPTIATAIATALTTGAAWTAFIATISPTTSFLGVRLRDIRSAGQPEISSTGASIAGGATGTELPDETAIAVTLRTGLVGISNRGRAYLPGFSSASIGAGNIIAAATVTAVQNWANGWMSAFSASGITMALAQPARAAYTSDRTGVAHPARAAQSTPITQALVRDNHFDSQRRRGLR